MRHKKRPLALLMAHFISCKIKKGNPRRRKPLCYLVLIPLDNIFERIETISGFGCFNKASELFTLAVARFVRALDIILTIRLHIGQLFQE